MSRTLRFKARPLVRLDAGFVRQATPRPNTQQPNPPDLAEAQCDVQGCMQELMGPASLPSDTLRPGTPGAARRPRTRRNHRSQTHWVAARMCRLARGSRFCRLRAGSHARPCGKGGVARKRWRRRNADLAAQAGRGGEWLRRRVLSIRARLTRTQKAPCRVAANKSVVKAGMAADTWSQGRLVVYVCSHATLPQVGSPQVR